MTQENKAKMRVILNVVYTLWVEMDDIRLIETGKFENLSDKEKQSEIGKIMKEELDNLLDTYNDLSEVLNDLYHYTSIRTN